MTTTGAKLALMLELRYAVQGPVYQPFPGRVVLPPEILHRHDALSLFVVAHEYEHLRQHLVCPLLFSLRWLLPVTWLLEWDANRRALKTIAPFVTSYELDRCRAHAWKGFWSYA